MDGHNSNFSTLVQCQGQLIDWEQHSWTCLPNGSLNWWMTHGHVSMLPSHTRPLMPLAMLGPLLLVSIPFPLRGYPSLLLYGKALIILWHMGYLELQQLVDYHLYNQIFQTWVCLRTWLWNVKKPFYLLYIQGLWTKPLSHPCVWRWPANLLSSYCPAFEADPASLY